MKTKTHKLLFFLAVIISVPLILSTTCNSRGSTWEIDSANLLFSDSATMQFINPQYTLFTSDTLFFNLQISPVINYAKQISYPTLIEKSYAWTKEEATLSHSISQLIITSNHDFNDISAGQNLNNKIVFLSNSYHYYQMYLDVTTDTISVQDFVYTNLVQGVKYCDGIGYFKEKPTNPTHVFTLDFIDSQGTHFTFQTDTLNWQ